MLLPCSKQGNQPLMEGSQGRPIGESREECFREHCVMEALVWEITCKHSNFNSKGRFSLHILLHSVKLVPGGKAWTDHRHPAGVTSRRRGCRALPTGATTLDCKVVCSTFRQPVLPSSLSRQDVSQLIQHILKPKSKLGIKVFNDTIICSREFFDECLKSFEPVMKEKAQKVRPIQAVVMFDDNIVQ